jgi:hypothetical protein
LRLIVRVHLPRSTPCVIGGVHDRRLRLPPALVLIRPPPHRLHPLRPRPPLAPRPHDLLYRRRWLVLTNNSNSVAAARSKPPLSKAPTPPPPRDTARTATRLRHHVPPPPMSPPPPPLSSPLRNWLSNTRRKGVTQLSELLVHD